MRLVTGHPCPRCGCRDTERIGGDAGWGRTIDGRQFGASKSLECQHCAHTFGVRDDDQPTHRSAPVAQPLRMTAQCPACKSHSTRVTSTRADLRKRYHKCRDCDETFSTLLSK